MPPQEHKSQRTEKPTGRRLKKARERGQAPRSRELPAAMVLAGFAVFGHFFGVDWLDRLERFVSSSLSNLGQIELSDANLMGVFATTVKTTAMLLVVPLGVLSAAGVAGNLIQGPPPLSLHNLKPKFEKLNPVQNLKKIFALRQLVEVLKSVLKMVLFGWVAYAAARDFMVGGVGDGGGSDGTLAVLVALTGTVVVRSAALAAGLGLLDYLFRRYDHVRGLMMSKREIKDEFKETEGDPMVRARIRQKQAALARSRMMADVAKATVVITNPEHYAVALRYVAGETDAPKVLAKGRALLAARIREIAAEHRVPIISDPPLARALYRSVAVGALIPAALFRAVAEILAMVLSRKGSGRTTPFRGEEKRP